MRKPAMKRGVHPPENKGTSREPIKYILPKKGDMMIYPMSQHIGVPCEPLVKVGDSVLLGEKIGDSEKMVSSPIYATVSGVVTDIKPCLTPSGRFSQSVFIENDGELNETPSINSPVNYRKMNREDILGRIREAGVVGLGGAGFPTHVKLNPPSGKIIDTILVNAAECEPYLTNDHRVILEEASRVLLGLDVILHLFPYTRAIIAIEDNKPDAIAKLKEINKSPRVSVVGMKTMYPQGAEKQLIQTCLGREVPSGGFPMDAGCIVQNVDTIIAIHRAFFRGRPLMRKVLTIAGGAVKNPGNYKARLGMTYAALIEAIGGLKGEPYKLVQGGPMMGVAHYTLDVPIVKTSSSLLLLTHEEAMIEKERDCFRCSKCVESCPMNLLPLNLNQYAIRSEVEKFMKNNGMDCMECGCCTYICPAKRHLSQSISFIRREILATKL